MNSFCFPSNVSNRWALAKRLSLRKKKNQRSGSNKYLFFYLSVKLNTTRYCFILFLLLFHSTIVVNLAKRRRTNRWERNDRWQRASCRLSVWLNMKSVSRRKRKKKKKNGEEIRHSSVMIKLHRSENNVFPIWSTWQIQSKNLDQVKHIEQQEIKRNSFIRKVFFSASLTNFVLHRQMKSNEIKSEELLFDRTINGRHSFKYFASRSVNFFFVS